MVSNWVNVKSQIMKFFVLFLFSLAYAKQLLFRDVQNISFKSDVNTVAGRLPSVPQLQCMSGCFGARTPYYVLCVNTGFADPSSGEPSWACSAQGVKFTSVVVACEGFAYRDDPYILEGSCTLEYSLAFNYWFIGFVVVVLGIGSTLFIAVFVPKQNKKEEPTIHRSSPPVRPKKRHIFETEPVTKIETGFFGVSRRNVSKHHIFMEDDFAKTAEGRDESKRKEEKETQPIVAESKRKEEEKPVIIVAESKRREEETPVIIVAESKRREEGEQTLKIAKSKRRG